MTDPLKQRAERIAELAAKATPGKWVFGRYGGRVNTRSRLGHISTDSLPEGRNRVLSGSVSLDGDGELIAAVPEMAQIIAAYMQRDAEQQAWIERLRAAIQAVLPDSPEHYDECDQPLVDALTCPNCITPWKCIGGICRRTSDG